tara:strand:- start:773 stop:1003 length:231 start_codon:yes stop_codon:yes gene_type:complete
MKDIKSILIGFLLATCMFLLMGHNGFPITPIVNVNESQVGRFQLSTVTDNVNIYESILDTKTGEIVKRNEKFILNN